MLASSYLIRRHISQAGLKQIKRSLVGNAVGSQEEGLFKSALLFEVFMFFWSPFKLWTLVSFIKSIKNSDVCSRIQSDVRAKAQ